MESLLSLKSYKSKPEQKILPVALYTTALIKLFLFAYLVHFISSSSIIEPIAFFLSGRFKVISSTKFFSLTFKCWKFLKSFILIYILKLPNESLPFISSL